MDDLSGEYEAPDAFEALAMFKNDRFNVDIGEVDKGELGIGGDALLLLDVGGLEDQNLVTLSLVQAGIVNHHFLPL